MINKRLKRGILRIGYSLGFFKLKDGFHKIESGEIYLRDEYTLSALYRKYDLWEPKTTQFIKDNVTKDMNILEFGSCLGYFTLSLEKYGNKVYGVEGEENYLKSLRKTVSNIENISLIEKFLGEEDTETTITLKSILDKTGKIDLAFMDIEGAEEFFFNQLFKMDIRPDIFVEWHYEILGEEKSNKLLSEIKKHYNIREISENHLYLTDKRRKPKLERK